MSEKQHHEVGDTVQVELPNGIYEGRISRVISNYGWTGEARVEVQGDDPAPFITICRVESAIK